MTALRCQTLGLVALLAIAACTEDDGSVRRVIGHVAALSGPAENYHIIREQQEPLPLGVRTEIEQGDFIRIGKAGETIVVELSNGSRETRGGDRAGDYGPILEKGRESSFLGNVLTSFGEVGRVETTTITSHRSQ